MSLSSLPPFPIPRKAVANSPSLIDARQRPQRTLGPLLRLAVSLSLAGTLYYAWREAGRLEYLSPPRTPHRFRLLIERFDTIPLRASRKEVEELIGPPTTEGGPRPEFEQIESMIAARPDRWPGIPDIRTWAKWINPEDKDDWVAVLFAGNRVWYKTGKRK